jgi:signal peptidase I
MGDIIAFPNPNPDASNPESQYIKRVIGPPGDIVITYEKGIIYIDGEPLPPEYQMSAGEDAHDHDIVFPHYHKYCGDAVFVLGDNRGRAQSHDSRFANVGCIPVSNITGKVPFRFYPFSGFGVIR